MEMLGERTFEVKKKYRSEGQASPCMNIRGNIRIHYFYRFGCFRFETWLKYTTISFHFITPPYDNI